MQSLHAILFDLDDTLYDFRSFWTSRLHRAVAHLAARWDAVDREALAHAAVTEWVFMEQWPDFLRRNGITDEQLIEATYAAFVGGWADDLVLPEDAVQILQVLRPRYKLGLITNGPAHIQRHKIERFGLAEVMDALAISGELGIAKPEPAIFQHVLAQIDVAPAEALFVGDSLDHDMAGAQAVGMPFVWFNRHRLPQPDDLPAHVAVITQLAELLPLLEEKA